MQQAALSPFLIKIDILIGAKLKLTYVKADLNHVTFVMRQTNAFRAKLKNNRIKRTLLQSATVSFIYRASCFCTIKL